MRPTHSRFAAALATRIRAPGSTFPVGISVPENPAISMTSDVLILIPARMASTRLPGKPLADIGGMPMIVRVMRRAREAAVGLVMVATDAPEIADAVRHALGRQLRQQSHLRLVGGDDQLPAIAMGDAVLRAVAVEQIAATHAQPGLQ